MYSLDFEEYLWAKGYKENQIEELYKHMLEVIPLSQVEYNVMLENFREYMVLGGMPAIVFTFIKQKNYSGTLKLQQQILLDYEEDITKYAGGLDKTKILNVYRKIPAFLGKDNKKFQISSVAKGAIYENMIADMLVKQGYQLYFYKNEKGTLEMDFFVRDKNSLIPIEVKAVDGSTPSLNNLITKEKYADIQYGIKFANKNIGFNGKFYTFPYFMAFLLKRFLREK